MDKVFSNEINVLKALAILLVVSGHLEFSLLGIFPPYSFQLALFFFISGCLFKEKYLYEVSTFVERRIKSLLIAYPKKTESGCGNISARLLVGLCADE